MIVFSRTRSRLRAMGLSPVYVFYSGPSTDVIGPGICAAQGGYTAGAFGGANYVGGASMGNVAVNNLAAGGCYVAGASVGGVATGGAVGGSYI